MKLILGIFFLMSISTTYALQPMSQNFGAQVNTGAFMMGQNAAQFSFLPAQSRPVSVQEGSLPVDPCDALRNSNTALRSQNGMAVPVGRTH